MHAILLAAILSATAVTTPVTYYVAVDGGSDSNSCLSAARPCKSIQTVVKRLPKLVQAEVDISLAAGSYEQFPDGGGSGIGGLIDIEGFTFDNSIYPNAGIKIIGAVTTNVGSIHVTSVATDPIAFEPTFTVPAPDGGWLAAGVSASFIEVDGGFKADTFVGKIVHVVSGTGSEFPEIAYSPVFTNTGNTITANVYLYGDSTTILEVITPASTLSNKGYVVDPNLTSMQIARIAGNTNVNSSIFGADVTFKTVNLDITNVGSKDGSGVYAIGSNALIEGSTITLGTNRHAMLGAYGSSVSCNSSYVTSSPINVIYADVVEATGGSNGYMSGIMSNGLDRNAYCYQCMSIVIEFSRINHFKSYAMYANSAQTASVTYSKLMDYGYAIVAPIKLVHSYSPLILNTSYTTDGGAALVGLSAGSTAILDPSSITLTGCANIGTTDMGANFITSATLNAASSTTDYTLFNTSTGSMLVKYH